MPDIRLREQQQNPLGLATNVRIDWAANGDGLDETQALATAIMVAVGSDALALASDPLPDKWFNNDRRGWWGDLDGQQIWSAWPLGCRLWTLQRDKITFAGYKGGSSAVKIVGMINDAIKPFVDLQVIKNFTVQVQAVGANEIDCLITLMRPLLPDLSLVYSYVWDEITRGSKVNILPAVGSKSPQPSAIPGLFTLGSSRLGGPDVLG